jgi:PAS domain S-box-containing protein
VTSARVMVVDDDEDLRESVCELLEDHGFATLGARNGSVALEQLRDRDDKPHVILLDLMMPGMNGWQFREEQLADPALARIPVVVMTASRELRGIAADEVLFKPIKLASLLEVLQRRAPTPPRSPPEPASRPERSATSSELDLVFPGTSALARLMRGHDWSATVLGPVSMWPQSLRSALSICVGSRFPIAIYWGPALTLLYNDAWSPILGSKHPAALGQGAREVWPEIWSTIEPLFQQVLTTGEATYSEDALLPMHRHGYTEECYFNFTFTPVRGEGGRVEGVFNAVIETTFRVVGERRTRVLRDLGEAIASARSAREACTLAARSLGEATRDVAFCALYLVDGGIARRAASTLPSSLVPEQVTLDTESPPWPLAEAYATGQLVVVDRLAERLGVTLPGGAWPEPANAAIVVPMTGVGGVAGLLVLGLNPRRALDEEVRQFATRVAGTIATVIGNAAAYEAERQRAEALAELDRAKTAFLGNVSHELRTPLQLLLGPTQDLLDDRHGHLTDDQRELLQLVRRNGLRLRKLVDSLLAFSRLEAGRLAARYERLDLAALTRDIASMFRAAIERAGLVLEVDCGAIDAPVFVDREMWEQIVGNLLSNALKFTFEGRIAVALRAMGGRVELEVTDTGVGISQADLARVFERFHRVEGARARTLEGAGIGLALVHELARLHGGTVRAESSPGDGTRFVVAIPTGSTHLPAERIVEAEAPVHESTISRVLVDEALRWSPQQAHRSDVASPEDGAAGTGSSGASQTAGQTAARILVVDDNADLRDYARRVLEPYWRVEAVGDGNEALAIAREQRPDLVLTDVMMPGLDGVGLLRALREDPRTRSIPVVMISARAGEEARFEGLEAGAEDYLVKPFMARELLARVRTQLELAQLRRELESRYDFLFSLLDQAPVVIAIIAGEELVFELANEAYRKAVGGRDVVRKRVLDVLPELAGQGIDELLRGVMQTGTAATASEQHLHLDRGHGVEDTYWTFVYAPLRGHDGVPRVMSLAQDVTEQVIARRQIEHSEQQFRRIVTQVQAGIAQTDLDGRFTLVNDRFRDIVGRSEAELRQLRMHDITHPDDLPGTLERFGRLIEDGTPFILEKRYVRPDGSIVWVQSSVVRIDDGEGRPQGVAAVAIDITQRRFAEAALRDSEERFRAMFETADTSLWEEDLSQLKLLVDRWRAEHGDGLRELFRARPSLVEDAIGLVRIRDVNPATLRMFGATSKQQLLESLHAIFVPETREVFTEELIALAEGRSRFAGEAVLRTLAGERVDVLLTMGRPAGDSHYERVLVTLVDISAQKQVEREREVRLAAAEHAVTFSEMFVGILGHDLRNPLAAIVTGTDLLMTREDNERIARPLQRIRNSAERMTRMIEQILDFTRARMGRGIPIVPRAFDLRELASQLVEEVEGAAAQQVVVDASGNTRGEWDSDRLAQVISNLLGNAIEHGDAEEPIRVSIDGSEAERIRLHVRNGGAIPEAVQPTLFDPFRRVAAERRQSRSRGLGLGLYIAQQIAEAHGGSIALRSCAGEGTTFSVTLPRRPTPGGAHAQA